MNVNGTLRTWGRCALLVAVGLTIAACAKEEPKADEVPKATPAAIAWADRTTEQRGQLMKEVIKPEMTKVFQGFDAEEFKEVSCKTCHGPNPKAVKFAMPSPDLPQLDPANNFEAHGKKEVEFMMNQVSPTMAELLGVEPWSPENQKGFGCFSCHTMAK